MPTLPRRPIVFEEKWKSVRNAIKRSLGFAMPSSSVTAGAPCAFKHTIHDRARRSTPKDSTPAIFGQKTNIVSAYMSLVGARQERRKQVVEHMPELRGDLRRHRPPCHNAGARRQRTRPPPPPDGERSRGLQLAAVRQGKRGCCVRRGRRGRRRGRRVLERERQLLGGRHQVRQQGTASPGTRRRSAYWRASTPATAQPFWRQHDAAS